MRRNSYTRTVRSKHSVSVIRPTIAFYIAIRLDEYFKPTFGFRAHLLTNLTIRVRWMDSTNLPIRVRWTDPTNLTTGRIFTAYFGLTNALRLIHQSYYSCPMDRFDESFHSCPMDGSDESNQFPSLLRHEFHESYRWSRFDSIGQPLIMLNQFIIH